MNKILLAVIAFVAWSVIAILARVDVMLPLQLISDAVNLVFRSLNLPIRLP